MDTVRFIAALGDVHGHFDDAWVALDDALSAVGVPDGALSAIFCVGDVEAQRDETEMLMVHGPAKYRELGEFVRVMSGEIVFPAHLYFIGGNHEPWAALDADGGLVCGAGQWAPGVTWLGRAGVLDVAGLRVAFLSGIQSPAVSRGTLAQRPAPRDPRTDRKRRTYWVDAELAKVRRAGQKAPVDLLLTHDWPAGVGEDRRGKPTGDEQIRDLLTAIRPSVSCHGHMHHAHTAQVGPTSVNCLGHIRSGASAVALFAVTGDGALTRVY